MLGEYLAADGSGADLIITPAGGSRKPATAETVAARQHYLQMAGNEVFRFAVRILGKSVEKALEGTGLTIHDLDYVSPHQANIRIIEAAARRLDMPMERMICNIHKYGNTSAASIPLALDEAVKDGRIKDGDLIALVAFGSGMTWGSSIIRWGK